MAKTVKTKKDIPLIPPGHKKEPESEETVQPELTPEEELDIIPDEEEDLLETPPDEEPAPGEGP